MELHTDVDRWTQRQHDITEVDGASPVAVDHEGTLVSTAESFAGEPVEAARDELKSQLDFSLTSWLGYLKAAAEND